MSCLEPNYLPNPTHIGSRVENRCVYDTDFSDNEVFIPQLKISIPISSIQIVNDMLRKGNILQYKNNSSN